MNRLPITINDFFPSLKYLLIFLLSPMVLLAQEIGVKDLAVPNSPAFVLTEMTPSVVQSPGTPKSFVLGIAQSFQSSSDGFPQNYSVEFAPYWWARPDGRSIYTLAGVKMKRENGIVTPLKQEDFFSGMKFTSLSMAFINKDMIPDTSSIAQKVFSVGIRSTIVKVHRKDYAPSIVDKINNWHAAAQIAIENIQNQLVRETDPEKQNILKKQLLSVAETSGLASEINDIMNQKPLFQWDAAAAYATYGVNDSIWETGRYGVWTTLSSYLPLDLGGTTPNKNYLNLNLILRYQGDHFQKNDTGELSKINSLDFGGKLALEFDKLSVGIESLYRYGNGIVNTQNSTVGIINYQVAENIYINGAFGKNFELSNNRLIVLFGINWGFGTETVNLPK